MKDRTMILIIIGMILLVSILGIFHNVGFKKGYEKGLQIKVCHCPIEEKVYLYKELNENGSLSNETYIKENNTFKEVKI